jgi:hypothetical protein
VHWLTSVSASESLDYLSTFTPGDSSRKLTSSAIVAIAMHGDPTAADRLIGLARRSPDRRVRGDALFWIAQRAGDKTVEQSARAGVLRGSAQALIRRV